MLKNSASLRPVNPGQREEAGLAVVDPSPKFAVTDRGIEYDYEEDEFWRADGLSRRRAQLGKFAKLVGAWSGAMNL